MSASLIWVVALVVLGLAAGVGIGVAASWSRLSQKSEEISEQEAAVQAKWEALASAERVMRAFWDARTAMRDEAVRHTRDRRTVDGEWR